MAGAIVLFVFSPALQLILTLCAMLMAWRVPKTREGKGQAWGIVFLMIAFNIVTWLMYASWFMGPSDYHVESLGLLSPCVSMFVTLVAITSIKDTHPVTSGPFKCSFAAFLVAGVLLALGLDVNDPQRETKAGHERIQEQLRKLCRSPRETIHRRVDGVTGVLFTGGAQRITVYPLSHPYRYIDAVVRLGSDEWSPLSSPYWRRYDAAGEVIFRSGKNDTYQQFIDDLKKTSAENHPVPRYAVTLETIDVAKEEVLRLEELKLQIVDWETKEVLAERTSYQTRYNYHGELNNGCPRQREDGRDFVLKVLKPAPVVNPERGENSGK